MVTDDADDLGELRSEIDRLDDRIADLVADRVQVAEDVASVKADAGRSLVDADREGRVVSRYEASFEEHDLPAERGEALARYLIETALETERDVAAHG